MKTRPIARGGFVEANPRLQGRTKNNLVTPMIGFNQPPVKGADGESPPHSLIQSPKEYLMVFKYRIILPLGFVFVIGILILLGLGKIDIELWNVLKIIPIKG
jgi:hypothetical protein